MSNEDAELQQLQQDANALEASFNTLLLSTLSATGHPNLSYSPYLRQGDSYYVFISELAAHTQDLLANPACSVMFIRDESESRNLFARERLIFQCQAKMLERTSTAALEVLPLMQDKLGETMALLQQLGDFRLFKLRPQQGRYVVGFGKAYRVDGQTRSLSHIGPDNLK